MSGPAICKHLKVLEQALLITRGRDAQYRPRRLRATPTYRWRSGRGTGPTPGRRSVKIKLTSIYVDDQEKALHFYTNVLGFEKKADFSQGPFRWLTVASPEEPDGTQLQLALNDNPAGKAYQQALRQQNQPAVMFFTDDIEGEHQRIVSRGGTFTMSPTQVTGSTIAQLDDTCGNLVQITQLARW